MPTSPRPLLYPQPSFHQDPSQPPLSSPPVSLSLLPTQLARPARRVAREPSYAVS